ncbi:MAG TPA: flagellar biosynthesis protein FlhB [Candidatus Hydrogenedentes bacterium]|nr:flagellar biosynthesis protein FlhB [Candidatus Hydrogenedentota bacterium]
MPEESGGEKTLPASPRKRQRAREEGNIAKSQDLNSAIALLVALAAIRFLGMAMFEHLIEAGRFFFGNLDALLPTLDSLSRLSLQAILLMAQCVLPFALIMIVAGLTVNFIQVGVLFTAKPLTPKPDRINPITGFKKFVSIRSFAELVKSLLKLTLVSYLVWLTFRSRAGEFVALMELTPPALVSAIASLVLAAWWRVALAMLVIGVLDYGFQRWQYERDLMMTVQEARRELKELEGDPQLKARIRRVQRQLAAQRMMREVPKADVVITNPTTYAVALRYDMAEMAAPIVVAKGARLVAEKIRNTAVEHDVPIVRKPELARTIYRTIEINHPVPENLFRAVAEVLAYVYEIDRRASKLAERKRFANSMRQAV